LLGNRVKGAKVIVASNPTRGLDISLTIYVMSLLKELRNKGVSVLLVSSDLDEIMELSDRIAVMFDGKILGILSRVLPTNSSRRIEYQCPGYY
jgi:ABC-type uncharacterized transport system ATPase subunit